MPAKVHRVLALSPVQLHRLRVAITEASSVLLEVKSLRLTSDALRDMRALETAVQALEVVITGKGGK